MKKLICLVAALVLSLSLISCGPEEIDPGLHENDNGSWETPIVPVE